MRTSCIYFVIVTRSAGSPNPFYLFKDWAEIGKPKTRLGTVAFAIEYAVAVSLCTL